ncbi:MAG TPA: PP2C family protein-serine/threonine phosphatase [Candidatus Dormibacteraeota bacterium]|nr:PP2C family protein-serine/threonine phosphatase [Candidatus Dormibacteraeota bacterium]
MRTEAFVIETSNDWTAACEVQKRFLQYAEPAIDTLSYSARCRQVRELGGDCYDFVPLPHNRLALAVGDAAGKGLAAALMISNVQSSLRTAAAFAENDGAAVLGAVNRQVHASSLADRYATLFYGVFDGETRTLQYVNAGHNPPMVIRRDRSIAWLETGGPPVGVFPDWTYEEAVVQLNPGDLVLAYTDGVTEAVNSAGEEWGVEGLLRTTLECDAQCPDDIVQALFISMDNFSRGSQTDDATIVLFRVH